MKERRQNLRRPRSLLLAALLAAQGSCVPEFLFDSEKTLACDNGAPDEGETDTDCGGVCTPCGLGKRCTTTSDCGDGSCIELVCRNPSCADKSLSPGETDIDCGGAHCAACLDLESCELPRDCESNSCVDGRCQESLGLGGSGGNDLGPGGMDGVGGFVGSGGIGNSGGTGGTGGLTGTGGEPASGGAGTGGATTFCDSGTYAFCDDFEAGTSLNWTTSGGTWGVLTEGANHYYTGAAGSDESIAGSNTWTNQIVEARVKVLEFGGTSASYRVGILARFSGPSDFFTLSLDQTGQLRLLKSTSAPSGSVGTCGSLPYPIDLNTWYTFRLEVTGPGGNINIKSYVNNVAMHDCQTTLTSVTNGKIGVLTVGTGTRAAFDDVTVVVP